MNPDQEKEVTRIKKIAKRYFDAYRVAKTIDGFGGLIKGAGVLFAVLLAFIGFFVFSQSRDASLGAVVAVLGIIIAAIVGVLFFFVGVLVSAQGQILKASLDAAVNTSPFLEIEEKAKVMSV